MSVRPMPNTVENFFAREIRGVPDQVAASEARPVAKRHYSPTPRRQ